MMKRVADFLKDLGGVAQAAGTANALTLVTYNSFTAYRDGLVVTLRAASTNTGETTLSVNSVGTKPVVKIGLTGEEVLEGGEIHSNGIYELVYSEDLNGAAGAWLLINPSPLPVDQVMAGVIEAFGGDTAPDGYLECDGSAVSRATYARLFTAIGTKWGTGDGSTTFNLPDLKDEFLRGAGDSRVVGSSQTDAIKSHLHAAGTLATASAGAHTHTYTNNTNGSYNGTNKDLTNGTDGSNTARSTGSAGAHTHTITGSTASTGDTETRPHNKAVLFIIKI
jgi:microcystin-dependent protein